MSNSQKVLNFIQLFKQSHDVNIFDKSTAELLAMRHRLIEEEISELRDAIAAFVIWSRPRSRPHDEAEEHRRAAFVEIIDSLGDLLYVTYGFFHAFGVDPDAAFEIVHRANMTKLSTDGKPVYREDGKILKSARYTPPDFGEMLKKYIKEHRASAA